MSNVDSDANTALANMTENTARHASLSLDPAKYRDEVDQFDITEAQKQELLTTLWSIMRSFVELGFTVDLCATLLHDLTPIPNDEELR